MSVTKVVVVSVLWQVMQDPNSLCPPQPTIGQALDTRFDSASCTEGRGSLICSLVLRNYHRACNSNHNEALHIHCGIHLHTLLCTAARRKQSCIFCNCHWAHGRNLRLGKQQHMVVAHTWSRTAPQTSCTRSCSSEVHKPARIPGRTTLVHKSTCIAGSTSDRHMMKTCYWDPRRVASLRSAAHLLRRSEPVFLDGLPSLWKLGQPQHLLHQGAHATLVHD